MGCWGDIAYRLPSHPSYTPIPAWPCFTFAKQVFVPATTLSCQLVNTVITKNLNVYIELPLLFYILPSSLISAT